MSRAPINLDEFKQRIRNEKAIAVEAGGQTFEITPPELLSDEDRQKVAPLLESDDPTDEVELARLLCDDYDGFVAAGGSATLLAMLMVEAAKGDDDQGVTEGEGSAS